MGVHIEIGTCSLFLWLQGRVWKSFPEPVCFLRHRCYHGLISWFTEPVLGKILLLEFAPSFWNKLGLLVGPGPVRCCLLWHTVESFWNYVLHGAQILHWLSTNCGFVVCFLVCGSPRKDLDVWIALNKGEVLLQASA